MTKPVALRKAASISIERAIAHYAEESGAALSLRFIAALEVCYWHVRLHPGSGSPRYGTRLNIPGLRSWPLARFPYLIFYFDRADQVDVVDLLHSKRDIDARLNADRST
jgi:toxin ParE1/3/4